MKRVITVRNSNGGLLLSEIQHGELCQHFYLYTTKREALKHFKGLRFNYSKCNAFCNF